MLCWWGSWCIPGEHPRLGWDGMGGPLGWERSVCWHGSIFQHDFLLQGLVKDWVSVSLQPRFPAVLYKSWCLFESINNERHKVPKVKRPCSPPLWRSMGSLLDLHDLTAFMVWSCCCFCSGISKSNLKCSSQLARCSGSCAGVAVAHCGKVNWKLKMSFQKSPKSTTTKKTDGEPFWSVIIQK